VCNVERCTEPGVRWLERGTDTVGCSTIRRIMAWGERKREGRWGAWVEMEQLKWALWSRPCHAADTPPRRKAEAEHKIGIGRKMRGCRPVYPSINTACRLFFCDLYLREPEASRPAAPVTLWLTQARLFRIRDPEYGFACGCSLALKY